jgi:predicted HTH transcriptional regulator
MPGLHFDSPVEFLLKNELLLDDDKITHGCYLLFSMDNPQISQSEIAEIIGITTAGVFWNIKQLKAKGILERIGADKGGHWKVL